MAEIRQFPQRNKLHVIRAKITRWISEAATHARERVLELSYEDSQNAREVMELLEQNLDGCTITIQIHPKGFKAGDTFVKISHVVKE